MRKEAAVNMLEGMVAKGFEAVRDGFVEGQRLDGGGAQLCVYRHGEKVVDLWTGQDKINTRPYNDNTIAVLMSCTKGMLAIMAHMLVERGDLDLNERVAYYWPEFSANGKGDARVSHILSHTIGLSSFDAESGIGPRDLLDWKRCTRALADMAPLWAPGVAASYHAVTFGYLVGEVIRRITGKLPGQFFADEIAGPLQLDLWIGLPASEEHRVAPHYSETPRLTPEQAQAAMVQCGVDIETRVARGLIRTIAETTETIDLINSREGRAANIPAANGVGTARSLARLYAAAIGEVDGVRLLNRETVERARVWQTQYLKAPGDLAKLPAPDPQRMALGFGLPRACDPMLGEGSFGHAGAGGRRGFAHAESGVAVGYVCNNMVWDPASGRPDPRWAPWSNALKAAIGV
ncbi:MAG: serine hydrolase domain-containing protein [Hyphomonadaceae bacterium]